MGVFYYICNLKQKNMENRTVENMIDQGIDAFSEVAGYIEELERERDQLQSDLDRANDQIGLLEDEICELTS